MRDDALFPVLQTKHYRALDRRLTRVVEAIRTCISNAHDISQVIRTRYDHPNVSFDWHYLGDCVTI
jgi:hypothetical protein